MKTTSLRMKVLVTGIMWSIGVISVWAGESDKKRQQDKNIAIVKNPEGKRLINKVWCVEGMKKRGYLGVRLTDLTAQLREHFGVPKDTGVMVSQVEKDSPAAKAGIKVGDILLEVDGEGMDSSWKVVRKIGKKKKDQKAKLKIFRQGKELRFSAVIQERTKPQIEVGRFMQKLPDGGFYVQVDTEALEESLGKAYDCLPQQLGDIDIDIDEETLIKLRDIQDKLRDIDFDFDEQSFIKLRNMESKLEERLKEVEKKLKKLEKKLRSKLSGPAAKQAT